MRDCCRSRKGFELEERHGINERNLIGGEATIAMTYRGLRHGPPDIIKQLERGGDVDPASYYFRISPMFETAGVPYDWLNRILAVGIGHRQPDGPVYSVFEML
jgi:Protein of unknown function (DUF3237)